MIVFDPTHGFMLASGWALLKGQCPLGQTQRTQAGAAGTTLLLQVDNSGPVKDRVYLIASGTSSDIRVKPISSGATRSFVGATQFQYYTNTLPDGPVTPTSGAPPIASSTAPPDDYDEWAFLMRVKEVADVVGMWPP